jgi:uncharacterized protein (DUF433 family)
MIENPDVPVEPTPRDAVAEEALDYGDHTVDSGPRDLIRAEAKLDRITFDPKVMTGRPCIRGMRITVGTILGLLTEGASREEVLAAYPFLEAEDIRQAMLYATLRCSNERVMVVHE